MKIISTSSMKKANSEINNIISLNVDTQTAKVIIFPAVVVEDGYAYTYAKRILANELVNFGFMYKNIDIFQYFSEKSENFDISKYDVVCIPGGNTFILRFICSKYFDHIKKAIELEKLIITESAGTILLTKDISIAGFADENPMLEKNTEGLSVYNFDIKPHFGMWYKYIQMFKSFSKITGRDIVCLWDDAFIYAKDDCLIFYGKYMIIGE